MDAPVGPGAPAIDAPPRTPAVPAFWIAWLKVATAGVALFGLSLVLFPSAARQAFSWMLYADPARIDGFGAEAVRYVSLVHAVIGGVLVGWGAALFLLVRSLLARGSRLAWNVIALSVGLWFVPDTLYSLLSGYWQNAVLNALFLASFAVPLFALRKAVRDGP